MAGKKGNGGRKIGSTDVAPKIREAFIRAVKRNGGSGYLATMMEKSLDKDFIGTLNALSKFNPKTQNVNNNNTLQINIDSNVRGWIEGFSSGVKSLDDTKAIEHIPADTLEVSIEEPAETVLEPLQGVISSDPVG